MEEDLLTLARAFVAGRSLKKGDTIQLVKDLLARAEGVAPVLLGIPAASGYDGRSPVVVTRGPSGSTFMGPSASRWYTRAETRALAGELARAAAPDITAGTGGVGGAGGAGPGPAGGGAGAR